jgi:hypothetical protein
MTPGHPKTVEILSQGSKNEYCCAEDYLGIIWCHMWHGVAGATIRREAMYY